MVWEVASFSSGVLWSFQLMGFLLRLWKAVCIGWLGYFSIRIMYLPDNQICLIAKGCRFSSSHYHLSSSSIISFIGVDRGAPSIILIMLFWIACTFLCLFWLEVPNTIMPCLCDYGQEFCTLRLENLYLGRVLFWARILKRFLSFVVLSIVILCRKWPPGVYNVDLRDSCARDK